ncbi:MAG: signal transduction histidine kinase [Paracoccaceae bacterium]
MRHPWHALTRLLTEDPGLRTKDGSPMGEAVVREAWTETAARLGLVRLAWWAEPWRAEPELVYPGLRSAIQGYSGPRRGQALTTSRCGGEEEQSIEVDGTLLVAAAAPGNMPSRAALLELGTLALAVRRKEGLLEERSRAQGRLAQAHATAAAGHDLRNELTRALLFAGRGQDGDAAEVVRALGAARELAQSALLPPVQGAGERAAELTTLDALDLRTVVTEEVRAAAAAARAPLGRVPSVRLKCPKRLTVLVHERTFRRAIRNVALNAMEATVRGAVGGSTSGAVTVLVERLDHTTVSGFGVRLIVEDEGVGMSAPEVKSFLDPRGRTERDPDWVEASSAGKPASTGLGTASLALALAASSIPLRVESAQGAGAKLTFWLREISDPRAPVPVVVDPDGRRAHRRVMRLREKLGAAWAVKSAAAAAPLVRSGFAVLSDDG